KLCGLPGKVGIDGKDVGPLVAAGRIAEVLNYYLCDVAQTAALFLRVQLFRGELQRETYLGEMQRLIQLVRADERLAPVARAFIAKRLLLVQRTSLRIKTTRRPSTRRRTSTHRRNRRRRATSST